MNKNNLSKTLTSTVLLGTILFSNAQAFADQTIVNDTNQTATDIVSTDTPATNTPADNSDENQITPDHLIMTEIHPNDISRDKQYGSGSNDLMEYVEITNPTDKDIKFNDEYSLNYCNSDKEEKINVSSFNDTPVIVPAKKSVILWIYREGLTEYNTFPTLQEFKDAYKIADDINVYKVTSKDGLGDINCGLDLYKSDKSVSKFTWTSAEVSDGTSVTLQPLHGMSDMHAYQKKVAATAGTYDENQIKYVEDLKTSPDVNLIDTDIDSIDEGKQLFLNYSVKDSMNVEKVTVYYKTSKDSDYHSIETTSFAVPNKYYMIIPSDKLLGCDYVDYYVVAQNAYRQTTTTEKRIKVNPIDLKSGIRTNIDDNHIISGTYDFTSRNFDNKDTKMYIDDNELETKNTLEKEALLTFSYDGVDGYYQDGVTIGKDVIKIFPKCNEIPGTFSMTIPIDKKYLTFNEDGSASLKLTFRSGTRGCIWEDNTDEVNDEYSINKLYLYLTDGTVIKPDNIDAEKTVKLGDVLPSYDISYTIPKENLSARSSEVDTTKLSDGEHTLKVADADGQEKTVKFIIDNTAPKINVNINEGQTINSEFTPKIDIEDSNSANITKVTLDDKELKDDYTFNGADLKAGNHALCIEAEDAAGNKSTKSISFKSDAAPSQITQITNSASGEDSENITVKTNGISSTVSLYKASRLDDINVIDGAGDVINSITPGSLDSIASSTNGENPYKIYEISVSGKDHDIVSVDANVQDNYNIDVNFYVYNTKTNSYEKIDTTKEGNKLIGKFEVLNHVADGKAKVLIQATNSTPQMTGSNQTTVKNDYVWDGTGIPAQYDFSMAWITDTQYYSEQWISNYYSDVNWIVNNADKLKIKYAIHTGDLVDDYNEEYQWKNADACMKVLDDAKMPYGVLAGNHDVGMGNKFYDLYWKYFGEDRFENNGVFSGSYKNNWGHYDLINQDGQDLIMLYMSWDISQDELEWMNEILSKYSDRKAIICLHYAIDRNANESYTSRLLNSVYEKNKNVIAVINGHDHGSSIRTIGFDDDGDGVKERTVYQICTDYQSASEGGTGYIKMIYFDLANNKIYMNSYSPVTGKYNFFDGDKLDYYGIGTVAKNVDIFDLDVDFGRTERTLSVKDFNANLLSSDIIEASASDGQTTFNVKGLKDGEEYSIYVKSENDYGLIDTSSPYTFQFKAAEEQDQASQGQDDKSDQGQDQASQGQDDKSDQGQDQSNQGKDTADNSNALKMIFGLVSGLFLAKFGTSKRK